MSPRQHIILVHGAANSSAVWRFWEHELALVGCTTHAVDLRGHGAGPTPDLSRVSMRDYDDVAQLAKQLSPPPVLVGWSMGGLVALMVGEWGRYVRARLAKFLAKKAGLGGHQRTRYTWAIFGKLEVYQLNRAVKWYTAASIAVR